MSFDPKIGYALIVTIFLQTAGAFVWAGQASARLAVVEQSVGASPEVAVRLARLEEQMNEARRSLARIEARLERAP